MMLSIDCSEVSRIQMKIAVVITHFHLPQPIIQLCDIVKHWEAEGSRGRTLCWTTRQTRVITRVRVQCVSSCSASAGRRTPAYLFHQDLLRRVIARSYDDDPRRSRAPAASAWTCGSDCSLFFFFKQQLVMRAFPFM